MPPTPAFLTDGHSPAASKNQTPKPYRARAMGTHPAVTFCFIQTSLSHCGDNRAGLCESNCVTPCGNLHKISRKSGQGGTVSFSRLLAKPLSEGLKTSIVLLKYRCKATVTFQAKKTLNSTCLKCLYLACLIALLWPGFIAFHN